MASDRDPREAGGAESRAAELRTFLIADVRGYTRYTHAHGDEAAAELAARFAVLARRGIQKHGGELLELRGDEALGVFTSPREAIRAAVAMQRLFREAGSAENAFPLGIGIGLDVGEAVAVEGGYRGGALNLAARLCSLARPGEILASLTVVSLARRIEGIRFEERGTEQLKGLERPVTVVEIVPEAEMQTGLHASWRRFRRRHVTRGRVAAAAVAAVLVAVAVGAAVVATEGEASPEAAGAHALDPATGKVVDSVDLGTAPSSIAVGEGGVWVLDADDKTVSQIDPESRKLERTFSTSSTPTDIAAGAGALWVGNGEAGPEADTIFPTSVSRLDPTTGQPLETIPLPRVPSGAGYDTFPGSTTQRLAVSADSVWVINSDLKLYRIDPRSNRIVGHVDDVKAQNVAVGDGDVWVTEDGKLVEIDTGTNEVARRVSVDDDLLAGVAVGSGAVWATAPLSGRVYRVDTGMARPVPKAIELDSWVSGIGFGQGAAWATNEIADTVYRLDPQTGAPSRVGVDSPRGVGVGAEGVWITTGEPPSRDTALPGSVCGDVHFNGEGRPDVLLVSDLTLKGGVREITQPMVDAFRLVLEQRGYEAGAFSVGYQSCDNATAQSGGPDSFRCGANAKAYARNLRVVGVFGSFSSPCSAFQIPITNAATEGPLAMVSPSATFADLTTDGGLYPTGTRSFFRLAAAEGYLPDAQVQLAKQLGHERMFVLESKGKEYGDSYLGELLASARRHGVTIVGTESFDMDSTSQAALARRVAASRPESVAIVGYLTEGTGALLRELRASLGPRVSISATDDFARADDLRELAGPASAGLYVVYNGISNDLLPPKGKQFLQTFAAANGGDPGPDFSASYGAQAAEIFLDAIARSDGTRASITQELHRTAVRDGILGDVRWDAKGDLLKGPITALRMEGGKLKPDRVLLVRPPRSAP